MATGDRIDPYRGYNFLVELGGITRAGFRECSGLDTSQDPIDYREGDEPQLSSRKLPGLNKFSNIVLKRGFTDDVKLWEWREKARTGNIERIDGSIILRDDKGETKWTWNFSQGWPTKWTGPTFNSTSNELAIETLEIVHEGITKG